MKIYFFKTDTNTSKGIYRESDFYDSDGYLLNEVGRGALMHIGEFNFDASDNMSELVIRRSDISDININRLTHIFAEFDEDENHVAYSINSVEYNGFETVIFQLTEDSYLSKMSQVNNGKILMYRNNNPSHFFLHDIADLSVVREREVLTSDNDVTGKWIVYTLARSGLSLNFTAKDVISLRLKKNYYHQDFEEFENSASLLSKYPNVATAEPASVNYYGKTVSCFFLGNWEIFQFMIKNKIGNNYSLEWQLINKVDFEIEDSNEFVTKLNDMTNVRLTPTDDNTLTFAIPILSNLLSENGRTIVSYEQIEDILYGYLDEFLIFPEEYNHEPVYKLNSLVETDTNILISKRIMTGSQLGLKGTIDSNGKIKISTSMGKLADMLYYRYWVNPSIQEYEWQKVSGFSLLNLSTMVSKNIIDFPALTPEFHSPFYEYYLNLWGKIIPLKSQYSGKKIYVETLGSNFEYQVIAYVENISNTLFNENLQITAPTSSDKYAEFLSQNANYNNSKLVNGVFGGVSKLGSAVLTGAMSGNAVGAVASLATAGFSIIQEQVNYAMQEDAMRRAPDTLKQGSTDYTQVFQLPFGLFMFRMKSENQSYLMMRNEYFSKGHPTNKISFISDLPFVENSVYTKCKTVSGILIDMPFNFHITSSVNERLANGVVLLENHYE